MGIRFARVKKKEIMINWSVKYMQVSSSYLKLFICV